MKSANGVRIGDAVAAFTIDDSVSPPRRGLSQFIQGDKR